CDVELEGRISAAVSAQNYNEALAVADELEKNASIKMGAESRCFAASLSERATLLQLVDRGFEAPPIFERAIELLRQTSDPQDPKLSLALNNYGVNLYFLRRYAEAARRHEEALELRKSAKPLDQAAIGESLHNLADAYRGLHRPLNDVKGLYLEAIQIKLSIP